MILASHTLKSYDEKLEQLLALILEMGGLVRQMVLDAKESLRKGDPKLGEAALDFDRKINALDSQIEESATLILALQNPMAIDLRFVTSAIKIAGILERAGDLAKNIIQRSPKMGENIPPAVIARLEDMADVSATMISDSLLCIQAQDQRKAAEVWRRDDLVDEHYHQIFAAMQQEMQSHPENIASCTHVVFAAKNFERVADYATNLAKTVYYVATGTRPDKAYLQSLADQE